jgi:hypothetical protein
LWDDVHCIKYGVITILLDHRFIISLCCVDLPNNLLEVRKALFKVWLKTVFKKILFLLYSYILVSLHLNVKEQSHKNSFDSNWSKNFTNLLATRSVKFPFSAWHYYYIIAAKFGQNRAHLQYLLQLLSGSSVLIWSAKRWRTFLSVLLIDWYNVYCLLRRRKGHLKEKTMTPCPLINWL